jgi:hypothetical protein
MKTKLKIKKCFSSFPWNLQNAKLGKKMKKKIRTLHGGNKLILKTGKIARLVGDPIPSLLVKKHYGFPGENLQDPLSFFSFAKLVMIFAKTSVVEY